MLVHRKNDEQSGSGKPATDAAAADGASLRPHKVSHSFATEETAVDAAGENDTNPSDDGKTHMIGDALKSVYQRTLEEEIPDDFLDLLKQLK